MDLFSNLIVAGPYWAERPFCGELISRRWPRSTRGIQCTWVQWWNYPFSGTMKLLPYFKLQGFKKQINAICGREIRI